MNESQLPNSLENFNLRYSFAKNHRVLLTEINQQQATVTYAPNATATALIELRRYLQLPLNLVAVTAAEFSELLAKRYESKSGAAEQLAENISEKLDLKQLMRDLPKTSDILESDNDAPIISLLNAVFSEAVKRRASDIHLETFEDGMSVRFRIDGVLQSVLKLPQVLAPLIVSRIKVLATLNIAEKRLPQDGHITIKIAAEPIDVRVSTIPASHGERVVMRLLNKKSIHLELNQLGMEPQLLHWVEAMIAKPHGVILVTGPTGSGKTTSLYAMLTAMNVPGRNILTVEDPVEYDLAGIGQIQVNPKVEMSFARGLRAILRQDPDIIMVGEIRDRETASIAVQSSLTGHLVLSTLHTNTAIGAITRLRDMGMESFLLSSSLLGVIAQRLVRKLCHQCRQKTQATAEQCQMLMVSTDNPPEIYTATGCDACSQTGFKGRTGIYEVMMLDNNLRAMVHDNASEHEIEVYVRQKFPSIYQDGLKKILAGVTTIDEVIRVTSE